MEIYSGRMMKMSNPSYFLPSTMDATDRSAAIEQLLQQYGVCVLGSGDYYVSGISMPENSTITGMGKATRLFLLENAKGAAIRMNSFCTVKHLSVTGGEDSFEMPKTVGDRHGISFEGTATPQDWSGQPQNIVITGCFLSNFTGGGILLEKTGYNAGESACDKCDKQSEKYIHAVCQQNRAHTGTGAYRAVNREVSDVEYLI